MAGVLLEGAQSPFLFVLILFVFILCINFSEYIVFRRRLDGALTLEVADDIAFYHSFTLAVIVLRGEFRHKVQERYPRFN